MSAKSTEKEATNKAAKAAQPDKTAPEATEKPVDTQGKTTGQKTGKTGKAVKAEKEEKAEKAVKEEKTAEKATKKPAAKKPATKKAEKPEPKTDIFLEYQGHQILESDIIAKVKAAFVKSGHRASSIKSLQVYMKPEESKAYYVINDNKFSGDVDLY